MVLEAYGTMLRLKCHFRNDKKGFDQNKFKLKSTSDPTNKDAAIKIYLSSLEEKFMQIEIPQNKYKNLIGKSPVHFIVSKMTKTLL